MINNFLTTEDSLAALRKMKSFHDDLLGLMNKHGFDLLENSGRRNILLSQSQEKYFAEVLSDKFAVRSDGRTGEPDIVIETLDKELECKLTSPHRQGTIAFQTDYETLLKKGSLDYLYVVADKNFENFAVIHYNNLTCKDFRPLSSGARGKTQLMKHKAHDRANVLVGEMISMNQTELSKLREKIKTASTEKKRQKIQKSIQYWKTTPEKYKIKLAGLND